jgi:hypothetical protein
MNKIELKLLNLFADLSELDQQTILSFTEFLVDKEKKEGKVVVADKPLELPRPEQERVVAAIKRLSATYPMLKKNSMLNETAALMSEHILKGRAATDIIDELQILFKTRYEQYCFQREPKSD